MAFKTPIQQADDLIRQARKNTLNGRINYKGNYENFINGGSHALNNQSHMDSNEYAKAMNDPNSGWVNEEWLKGINPRYANPKHEDNKAYHRYTPSTKRGRRVSDIFFETGRNGIKTNLDDFMKTQELVNKYEGR